MAPGWRRSPVRQGAECPQLPMQPRFAAANERTRLPHPLLDLPVRVTCGGRAISQPRSSSCPQIGPAATRVILSISESSTNPAPKQSSYRSPAYTSGPPTSPKLLPVESFGWLCRNLCLNSATEDLSAIRHGLTHGHDMKELDKWWGRAQAHAPSSLIINEGRAS